MAEFPVARSDSVMIIRNGQLMLWGGYTQRILGEGEDRFIVAINLPDPDIEDAFLEVCDLESMEWQQQKTHGSDIPILGKGTLSAVSGQHLYIFGGLDDEDYRDTLYRLDLESLTWTRLSKKNGPSARSYGGMVAHRQSLVIFGGIGKLPPNDSKITEKGAEFIKDDKFGGEFISAWNNTMYEYNIVTDSWQELGCTGSRPPPLERFSFDKIDSHRALLFGGKRGLFTAGFSDIYILDLDIMEWKGPIAPSFPDQIWPTARGVHATACLVDPESDLAPINQRIILFWGEGLDAIHLSDIWLLHVATMTWKEINLKIDLIPRKYHMCCSNFIEGQQTDVVVYGGNKRRKSKFERNVMTDMVIFRFGSVRKLQEICVKFLNNNQELYKHCIQSLPFTLHQELLTAGEQSQYILYYL